MGDIVVDTDGEAILRMILLEFVEDRLDHARRKLLAGQAVPSPDETDVREMCLPSPLPYSLSDGKDVEVERFGHCAGLFGAIEHCKGLYGFWKGVDEMVHRKRPVESARPAHPPFRPVSPGVRLSRWPSALPTPSGRSPVPRPRGRSSRRGCTCGRCARAKWSIARCTISGQAR